MLRAGLAEIGKPHHHAKLARQKLFAAQNVHQLFHLGLTEPQHALKINHVERKSFLPGNHRARPHLGQKFFRPLTGRE